MPTRRLFLKSSALAMFGTGSAPPWLSRAVFAQDAPARRRKVLIAIFQRGAVDGLNVVVPYADRHYYALRPTIAVPRPGRTPDSAIDLDGRFGLHPSLAALKPLWDRRQFAIIEAAGSPDPTRSHFDAQDYMESGTPGRKTSRDGWLNRALVADPQASPLRAVSFSPLLPRTLAGTRQAVAIAGMNDFQVRNAAAANLFEEMYGASADQVLNGTARETFEAVKLVAAIRKAPYSPAHGARYPASALGRRLLEIARIVKADAGLEVAFADVGGWDTHVNETGATASAGQLPNLLREFGGAIAAFCLDMGALMDDITIVTMSEFGRTARENGSRGTDHGHANVMFVLGGAVRGGRVYGDWPGLAPEQLYEGRDLKLTTDFRTVLAELVVHRLGNRDLAAVFPGFSTPPFRGFLRG